MNGKRISEMRKKIGINQEELAHMLSVNTITLSRWENGHFEPKVSMIKKLCEIFHCTETELLSESSDDKCQLVVSWNWDDFKKGEINMNEEKFKLVLDEDGKIGISGAGMMKTRAAIDEFVAKVKSELEIAFDTQVRRGILQEA